MEKQPGCFLVLVGDGSGFHLCLLAILYLRPDFPSLNRKRYPRTTVSENYLQVSGGHGQKEGPRGISQGSYSVFESGD